MSFNHMIGILVLLLHTKHVICGPDRCVYIRHSMKSPLPNHECASHQLCHRNYSIVNVVMPPYSEFPFMKDTLTSCCGNCRNHEVVKNLSSIDQLTPTTINNTDFVLPVLGDSQKPTMYGHHFIPILHIPNYLYITPKGKPVYVRLMTSLHNVYPLVIICLLMAVVAGFVTWVLETWTNEKEFSRLFWIGWFEGFWWSFISMTTVGYGDKTPKTVGGRLFAIIWILIGITIFGMLTALLTTTIMTAQKPQPPSMKNSKVGVLKYRIHDAAVVAAHGGIVVESSYGEFGDALVELVELLRAQKVKGIVLDKFTYHWIAYHFYRNNWYPLHRHTRPEDKTNIDYLVTKTMLTEKSFNTDKFSYGVLIKDRDVYEYFRDTITDNRLLFENSLTNRTTSRSEEVEDIFSASSKNFVNTSAILAGVSFGLFIVALFFEMIRRKYSRNRGRDEKNNSVTNEFVDMKKCDVEINQYEKNLS